jgi:inorganic phosphate transporter, PiT family
MTLTVVLLVVLIALIFEYINGFHDTANSIATVVATKVLSPTQAIILAATMNLLGAFWGTAVAKTIFSGLIDSSVVTMTPAMLICALLGGIVWNLLTWWWGLPSSSSHALIGGLCGAGFAASGNNWDALIWSQPADPIYQSKGLLWKVVVPMVSSPIGGFCLGLLMMGLIFFVVSRMAKAGGWLGRLARPKVMNKLFGRLQIVSAASMGFMHGTNDAQKTMGIIALALAGGTAAGALDNLPSWLDFLVLRDTGKDFQVPFWIVATCALVMAAGTAAGGWRIIKTLGHKLVKLHPVHGFAAETASATMIGLASSHGIPVSTTHNISAAIMGVGTAKRSNAIKWSIVQRMVWAWILTIPIAAGLAYLLVKLSHAMGWIAYQVV